MADTDALPLTPIDFSALLVLAEGPSYGYGIAQAMARPDAGGIRLAPGNLYQVLDRLLSRGWLRELRPEELPTGSDGRRRYYAITARGRKVLSAEAARLRSTVRTAERLAVLPMRGSGS